MVIPSIQSRAFHVLSIYDILQKKLYVTGLPHPCFRFQVLPLHETSVQLSIIFTFLLWSPGSLYCVRLTHHPRGNQTALTY